MVTKRFERWDIDKVIPYENNPRKNDEAVADVVESIKQCGDLDPIEVDEEGIILSGHTRLKAYQKLGYKQVDVVIYEGLNDEQKKKYRLLANKTGEIAEWDLDKLEEELKSIDFEGFDFGFDIEKYIEEQEENPYSNEVKIPQYEPTGAHPLLDECVDKTKSDELISEIESSSLGEKEKEFLKDAATRHNVFNYKNIAEYYANEASPEMQRLMEKSALVIIDIHDAIANGYCKLVDEIDSMVDEDEE